MNYICFFTASCVFLLWCTWFLCALMHQFPTYTVGWLVGWLVFEIPFVCHLKFPWSCFPYHFSFLFISVLLMVVLSALFLMAIISFPPRAFLCSLLVILLMHQRYPQMLVSPLPPSFFVTYCLPASFLGCKALWIVISFLVLWSICLSSSIILFRNSPEYLTRKTAKVFIPLIRLVQYNLVSSSFLVFLWYSFLIFSFIFTCLMLSSSNIPKYL